LLRYPTCAAECHTHQLARRSPLFESFFIGSGSSYVLADTLRMTNVFTWKPGSRPLEIENMDSSQEVCCGWRVQLLGGMQGAEAYLTLRAAA
jgi:hypothetical protein